MIMINKGNIMMIFFIVHIAFHINGLVNGATTEQHQMEENTVIIEL